MQSELNKPNAFKFLSEKENLIFGKYDDNDDKNMKYKTRSKTGF